MSVNPCLDKGLVLIGQRIILIQPKIVIEFRQPQMDLTSFLWCEAWQCFEYFGLAHVENSSLCLHLNQTLL